MELCLDDLVQESEKLLMEVQEDSDLPRITRTLDQMRHLGEKLYLGRGSHSDVKAARLLGPKMSYELPQELSSKLESLTASEVVESKSSRPEMDIQTFLRTERENALLHAICLAQKSVFEDVEERCDQYLQTWWKQESTGILSTLASSGGPLDTELARAPEEDLIFQRDFHPYFVSSTQLTRDEVSYAIQLDQYLSQHLTSSLEFTPLHSDPSHSLLVCLAQTYDTSAKSSTGNQFNHSHLDVVEIWNMIDRLMNSLQSEQIKVIHRDNALQNRTSVAVQDCLVLASLNHLELEFTEFLRVTVANQPRLARLGGRPGIRALVRAYLTLRFTNDSNNSIGFQFSDQTGFEFEDGLVDSKPVWPMIFYCLRAGDARSAIEIAREAVNNLGNFANILEDYIENRRHLRPDTQTRFRQACKQIIKTTRDPYKRLLYSIMGQCDVNDNHSAVASNIDDFLWVKLSHVLTATKNSCESYNALTNYDDTLNLNQLQTLIYDTYGEAHFDAWSQPLVYFKILCLTLQFEAAIGFLSRFEQLRCHAVHVALVLRDVGLLLIPTWLHSPLLFRDESDPVGLRRLNLARLVMLYTRKFEVTDPVKVLMYFYFLSDIPVGTKQSADNGEYPDAVCTNDIPSEQNLFITCVCELALATKELDLLVGSVNSAGVRKSGAIDRYCKTTKSRQELIRTIAQAFETRGQVIEAVLLYQLAASFSNPKMYLLVAIKLINNLLASLVSVISSNSVTAASATTPAQSLVVGQPDRSMVLRVATELAHKARQSGLFTDDMEDLGTFLDEAEVSQPDSTLAVRTLFYLLDLATFFDLVESERWQAAIDHIDQLEFFPSNPQSTHVNACVASFTKLPDQVRRPIPWVLYALMRCLNAKAGRNGTGTDNTPKSKMRIPEIRDRVRALIAYVGRIPHRLPSEIYARLTQMDMEIV